MQNIYRKLGFLAQEVDVEAKQDGSMVLRSPCPLGGYEARLGDYLYAWADKRPDQIFLAEKNSEGLWVGVTYREALIEVEVIAQSLLDRDLSGGDSLVILSGNSIKQALLTLAAMHIGVAAVPVSPAYSLMSSDYKKLKGIVESVKPSLIYVEKLNPFKQALEALGKVDIDVVSGEADAGGEVTDYTDLLDVSVTYAVREAFEQTGPNTIAKVLFTSGSTGAPKGVINTQRMLCSNQKSLQLIWPFLKKQPPVVLDWLPWHHTFGGNHNFNLILANGGSLYIDDGKPRPGEIEKTVTNLKTLATGIYFNEPLGYELLISFLEQDQALAKQFFSEMNLLFCAGAALPDELGRRLQRLSEQVLGYEIPMVSSWGSTETAPLCTSTYFKMDIPGPLGLPVPGVEIKLAATQGRYELRVRGPNVTPGYLGAESITSAAFDSEGFYCMGDAGKLADPADAASGIVFDGRLAEEFKLSSGTWVQAGMLRLQLVSALAPLVQDLVIAGPNRAEIGVLMIPNIEACRKCFDADSAEQISLENIADSEVIQVEFSRRLYRFNEGKSSSQRVGRAMFLTEPLSVDKGEMTDKGYINQRGVLESRTALVDELYRDGSWVMFPRRLEYT